MAEIPAAPRRTGRPYWQAQGIAELTLSHFAVASEQGDRAAQRRAFYALAGYYGKTRRIVRSALAAGKEPLAQAALRTLLALHRPLNQMHRTAPDAVPLALIFERDARDDLTRDLVARVLGDTPEPLADATIVARI